MAPPVLSEGSLLVLRRLGRARRSEMVKLAVLELVARGVYEPRPAASGTKPDRRGRRRPRILVSPTGESTDGDALLRYVQRALPRTRAWALTPRVTYELASIAREFSHPRHDDLPAVIFAELSDAGCSPPRRAASGHGPAARRGAGRPRANTSSRPRRCRCRSR